MQRPTSDEFPRRPGRFDDVESSVSLDREGSARRRREARAARAAVRRRRRFRRTVIVSVLLAMIAVSGTVYAVAHRADAPVASGKTNRSSSRRPSAAATPRQATTTPTAEASSSTTSTKPAARRTTSPSTTGSHPSATSTSSQAKPITVTVWNGAKLNGVAHSVGAELQRDGYDVVQMTNADTSDYRHTLIVLKDRAVLPAADTVRASLSIGKIEVTGRYQFASDVLVIVGKDWRTRSGANQ